MAPKKQNIEAMKKPQKPIKAMKQAKKSMKKAIKSTGTTTKAAEGSFEVVFTLCRACRNMEEAVGSEGGRFMFTEYYCSLCAGALEIRSVRID